MLDSQGTEVISLVGGTSAKAKRQAMERLAALPEKARFVIIATGKYVGEGFDFPRLDTLFLAMPIAWKGKVAQYAGRLHRLYEGKSDVLIYDYVDIHIPVLERMYHKRVKGYAAIGYTTKDIVQDVEKVGVIHTGNSFQPIYSRDLSVANKEIIIVSPFLRKHRLLQMMQVLSHAVMNSVRITVLTRPPDDFKEVDRQAVGENISLLEGAGIHVVRKSAIHQKFTIIDQHIVWYGSINFLSFGSSEETIMRLESHAIANELLGIL
jgi:phosphatidylserine/phosphatidylglycerophosphate/cardiolipin synthase-like enzyme